VLLEVRDSGPGIQPKDIDRIWNPFFTTKGAGQGTGLGLPITHRIVVRHGGRISVESEPGRGALFVVRLPIQGPGGES
jgi:signal transduction histidine kinase